MPIWKVSFTDGTYQVADADGGLYPLTMGGKVVTQFNQGWTPRGLQTGVPPLHVLELEHANGGSAIWLHDETLDFRANSVETLPAEDNARFMREMEPVVRTLYTECVLAPHAAIPAAAHRFDGMLPLTVLVLLASPVSRMLPVPDLVMVDALDALGAGYGSGETALSHSWITRALQSDDEEAQERFEQSGRAFARHLNAATGIVFYLIRSDKNRSEPVLFVPAANVMFARERPDFAPLLELVSYYAGNTERAVSLPEADALAPDMMVPPQHGLDEPPAPDVPEHAPPAYEPPASEPTVSEPAAYERLGSEPPVSEPNAPEAGRTVFEAPLSESQPVHDTAFHAAPSAHAAYATDESAYDSHPSAAPAAETPAPAPKQNWWQRLLGLGNP